MKSENDDSKKLSTRALTLAQSLMVKDGRENYETAELMSESIVSEVELFLEVNPETASAIGQMVEEYFQGFDPGEE